MTETKDLRIDALGDWKRTHDCGSLRATDVGRDAVLMGWVNSRRDLGSLIFIDLRDRGGLTQIVFDPRLERDSHRRAHVLRNEWVLAVKGRVSRRLQGQENADLPTGEIELKVRELKILNITETPPFQVDGQVDASETLRLKYRYLELRRPAVLGAFWKRHRIASFIRDYLNRKGFMEVETPFLTKSTPEGARDYLVPSRINRGHFYALPQSPQLFKQLLMIGGFDRYYQIVRCFRDEDLRADRQPEFTQVDLEMAFIDEEGVMEIFEGMMADVFQEILGCTVDTPLQRLEYHEAMDRFGTDRPDLRFGMELKDLTHIAGRSSFNIFKDVIMEGGVVKAITVNQGASLFSRKALDELSVVVAQCGAKGLAWVKVTGTGWQSSLGKFFNEKDQEAFNRRAGAQPGDVILIVAHERHVANEALGVLRGHVAQRLNYIKPDAYAFVWITRFPLLKYNEAEERLETVHHPFTAPLAEDLSLLDTRPGEVRARSYDLVLNGAEIGGGSIRIHDLGTQQKVFRLVAIMTGVPSIREIIAFPKTTRAACPLTDAPSRVDEEQLKELGLRVDQET
jgi:aspartyl-tRNA synthetase